MPRTASDMTARHPCFPRNDRCRARCRTRNDWCHQRTWKMKPCPWVSQTAPDLHVGHESGCVSKLVEAHKLQVAVVRAAHYGCHRFLSDVHRADGILLGPAGNVWHAAHKVDPTGETSQAPWRRWQRYCELPAAAAAAAAAAMSAGTGGAVGSAPLPSSLIFMSSACTRCFSTFSRS